MPGPSAGRVLGGLLVGGLQSFIRGNSGFRAGGTLRGELNFFFQGFFASIDKIFLLVGELGDRLLL